MKQLTLIALLGLACSSIAMADEAFKHEYENGGHWNGMQQSSTASSDQDSQQWISSELVWNEEYGVYDVITALHEDVFQERMLWSDHYADLVPAGMAFRIVYEDSEGSNRYSYKMASGELVPCMKTAQAMHPIQLARVD